MCKAEVPFLSEHVIIGVYHHRHVAIHARRQGHAVANARQMDYTTNVCDRRKDVNVFSDGYKQIN
jgi:hypothetical protein